MRIRKLALKLAGEVVALALRPMLLALLRIMQPTVKELVGPRRGTAQEQRAVVNIQIAPLVCYVQISDCHAIRGFGQFLKKLRVGNIGLVHFIISFASAATGAAASMARAFFKYS